MPIDSPGFAADQLSAHLVVRDDGYRPTSRRNASDWFVMSDLAARGPGGVLDVPRPLELDVSRFAVSNVHRWWRVVAFATLLV